ncbi:MAG TPA: efflux RND transporter permease subunit [Campylobacterales bacterium]|nr:efflux RND transporter permease subunit [Campylobacterales bacterium]
MYKLAISRPVTTVMFALSLLFFGLAALDKMPAALYPNVDFPVVVVTTVYKGASSEIVESKVSEKIEEAISGISGLEFVTSESSKDVSVVVAQFKLSKPIEEAVNDVRDKVSSAALSSEIERPVVDKFSINSSPVITLFLSGDANKTQALMKYADEIIKPKLQRLDGVGRVDILGLRKKLVKIYPDPIALAKYGVDLNEFASKIGSENVKMDGGRIIAQKKEWVVSIDADAKAVNELKNIKIKDGVLLADVASVEDGVADERSYANLNGKSGVLIQIKKITGANEIALADAVKSELPTLKNLSKEFNLSVVFDSTGFIKATLDSVKFDLLWGCILATLVVFLFLRNATLTLVAGVALPVSVLGVLAIMGFSGQTLNLLTLTALTLAIGIIIDDAIVVIENIYKKLESGMGRIEAAKEGAREIAFSVLAISAMLLAVFVPIANMGGIVGRFFTSFGLTVVAAVVISYIIAMTLIPMLGALVANPKHTRFYLSTERYFAAMESGYTKLLSKALRYRKTVLLSALLLFTASIVLSGALGMVFMPKEDKSQFDVTIKTDPGISMEEMKRVSLQIQKTLTDMSEVEKCSLFLGSSSMVHEGGLYVKLKPIDERERTQAQIMEAARAQFAQFKGFRINATEVNDIGGYEINTPFQLIIKADEAQKAEASALKLMEFLRTIKGTTAVQSNIKPKAPEISVKILSEHAAKLGVKTSDAARIAASAFSGAVAVSYLRERGKEYDITMRLDDKMRSDKDAVGNLLVKNDRGEMILLSTIAEITDTMSPSAIKRHDRQKQALVGSDLKDDLALDALLEQVMQNKDKWLMDGVSYELEGDAKYMGETSEAFGIAIGAAVIMIYLILASLYESPIQPLVIMSALPLSFTGAFIGLYAAGMNMSLFSMMGLMLLLGLVGKNSTLVVDAANRLREDGAGLDEATLKAGASRLRPILMTTTAMCFGMLPLALSVGEGSGVKAPMGVTVICGLLLSTLLSLFVVPAFYRLIAPLDDRVRKLYGHLHRKQN